MEYVRIDGVMVVYETRCSVHSYDRLQASILDSITHIWSTCAILPI